jgi:ferredoxin-NADP reductase
MVGATLLAAPPAGDFCLDEDDDPIVLIAGGIGITPLLSMLAWCEVRQPQREVWLFYGARNGREAAFAPRLRAAAAANPNIRLRLCFSEPAPDDRLGTDFHRCGRVDLEALRMALPLRPFQYYLCGPAAMMETLVPALTDWGVPDSHIHFEAFGPASVTPGPCRGAARALRGEPAATGGVTVTFAKTGRQAVWSPQSGSLLEFAQAQGVAVDAGCRAGGCGTCQTRVHAGEVAYRRSPAYDPEPGTCLLCVCTPSTPVTLEA